MGNVKIDFTQAHCPHRDVMVEATCKSGNVTMIVPRGWSVRIEQTDASWGDVVNKATGRADPGAPILHVIAYARLGNIKVRYPYVKCGNSPQR